VETYVVGGSRKGKNPMSEESLRIPSPTLSKPLCPEKRDIIHCSIVEIWSYILKLVNNDIFP
jgi:hypothetical protein